MKSLPEKISWSQFSRTVLDVREFLEKNRAVPNAVWFGSRAVQPESYLLALASVAQKLASGSQPPEAVATSPAELAAAQCVAEDSPSLWHWVIFPPGFHSEHLMELARLQAWTLKPALLTPAG